MISKESYKLLKNFPEKVCLEDRQPIHQELKEAGYLAVDPAGGGDVRNYRYYVTEKGRAAVDEYRREQRKERRESASVWLSLLAIAVSIFTLLSEKI